MALILLVILELLSVPIQSRTSDKVYIHTNEQNDNSNANNQCSAINEDERINCYPELHFTHSLCIARGCCWSDNSTNTSSPRCFFGQNYGIYGIQSMSKNETGMAIKLELKNEMYMAGLIKEPMVLIEYKTSDQLRIKISDNLEQRYEVPLPLNQRSTTVDLTNYEIEVFSFPFAIVVKRKSPETIIFDSRIAPLIFSDQFLSVSTTLNGSYVYGIGGRWGPGLIPFEWNSYPLFNADHRPDINTNGYETHPYYIVSDADSVYGVMIYNSNAQEFVTQPSRQITWRSIGGIFDIFFFMGPTPMDLMRQYTDLVGHSIMPPYWGLGFHICKWGYTSTDDVRDIVRKMKEAGIPQDAQWTDIDYMDKFRDFTFSWDGFGDLPTLSDDLHNDDLRHIIISEPHVSSEHSDYLASSDGVEMNVFVRDSDNVSYVTQKVWPGDCNFIDFGCTNCTQYLTKQFARFHNLVKFDGIWIDMNDPATFDQHCDSGKYNHPPYIPQNMFYPYLYGQTVCMDAIHTDGLQYNVHSIYATLESRDTFQALRNIRPEERPFIISRSSFVSQGAISGTWSGDSVSTFFDLRNSITSVVRSNLVGISLTGGDICGFALSATEVLCTRWYLVGAFFPFMRNHADHEDKTPFAFGEKMATTVRRIITERYKLLPFLYTLFYQSNVFGTPVIQPLFMRWNDDVNTHEVDEQFMWGSAMLISPGFEETTVVGYFPEGIWYDYWHQNKPFHSKGQYLTMYTPLDKINVHVLGGNILPIQKSALRTKDSRKTSFTLLAYANSTDGVLAKGELFWDDGSSFETYERGVYNIFDFTLCCYANNYELTSVASIMYNVPMMLGSVEINGVPKPTEFVKVNGVERQHYYDCLTESLVVVNIETSLLDKITLSWN